MFRDVMFRDSGGDIDYNYKSDLQESKELLLRVIMAKCKISDSDLHDISIIKNKLREENINEIINEK
jgi:hypothetical protein